MLLTLCELVRFANFSLNLKFDKLKDDKIKLKTFRNSVEFHATECIHKRKGKLNTNEKTVCEGAVKPNVNSHSG